MTGNKTKTKTKKKSTTNRSRQPSSGGRRQRGGRGGRGGGGGRGGRGGRGRGQESRVAAVTEDDLFAAETDAFLGRGPNNGGPNEEQERRDASINTEAAEEVRQHRAEVRGERLGQEVVIGPRRPPGVAPHAGEPGFLDAVAGAVAGDAPAVEEAAANESSTGVGGLIAEIEAAAPARYAGNHRGAHAGGIDEVDEDEEDEEDKAPPLAKTNLFDDSDDEDSDDEVQEATSAGGDAAEEVEDTNIEAAEEEGEVQFASGNNTVDAVADIENEAGEANALADHRAMVGEVEKMRIVPSTRLSYDRANFKLIAYFLDNGKANLISQPFRDDFQAADTLDKSRAGTRKTRRNLRRVVMACLKTDVPVDLTAVTYATFAEYVVSCRRDNGEFMSFSHYNTKRSGFTHLFFEAEEEMDDDMWSRIATLFAGLRRKIVRQNQNLGKRATTGRDRMPFGVYKYICRKLREDGGSDAIFAHAVLTLSWSLMSRSEQMTVANVMHIEWHSDCLVIYFHHRKTDQLGINKNEPWHIYANPLDPDICPVLSLGIYILTFDTVLSAGKRLFQGPDPYSRYSDALGRIGKKYAAEIGALGMDVKYLGTYSVRKGSGTYVTAGCTVAPPIISVCLRAGWSIGSVKERYLHYESAGDQYVARMATGLDVMSKDFAVSPPYFEGSEEIHAAVDGWVESFGGEGIKEHPHLRMVVKYLLASFAYHIDYLKSTIPSDSPFFSSIAFASMPSNSDAVMNAAVVRYPWDKTDQTPKLTGIPPHVAIICKLEGLEKEVSRLKRDLEGLPKQIEDLPTKIVENIGEGRQIVVNNLGGGGGGDGGGGGNAELVEEIRKVSRYFDQMQQSQNTSGGGGSGSSTDQAQSSGTDRLPPLFLWSDGSMNRLPENYKFTRGLTFKGYIREMLIGRDVCGLKTPPLRILQAKDVKHVGKSAHKRLSEMKELMKEVKRIGVEKELWKGELRRHWETTDATKLYEGVFEELKLNEKNKKRRSDEISWATVYNTVIRIPRREAKRQKTN